MRDRSIHVSRITFHSSVAYILHIDVYLVGWYADHLVQGFADADNVVFALFSEAPPRQVEIGEPEVSGVVPADSELVKQYSTKLANGDEVYVEHVQDGFHASVTRTVSCGHTALGL